MPTYEYRCRDCGHTFEEFQSMSAEPLKACPNCKKETLKRVFSSSSGMIFKGAGFYQTDYKGTGGGEKKETKKDEKTEVKTEPSKEKTAETKKSDDASSSSTANDKK
jgi:putative FmdB family regulatory protein